ncbi:Gfo/Idh/MocA family oxidoreductase [Pseudomonas sp. HR96]|uniref:Gfo/Idh/MocA family protein n=1 Tax=Pseudomonas sp. HR96 TaxID=1027966 RepID=UPI002A751B28|nr:Gfo/Idh/MocA family oxidoreductase [Pseudomonas sp. HR96]WPO98187.1 Gfo/Idh/MocA family oxidoreductase [Pseudomonas sp. HR96]
MAADTSHPVFTQQGPGTAQGPTLPASGAIRPPSELDRGRVENGQVLFDNWKGMADKPDPALPAPLPPAQRVGFAIVGLGRLALGEILPAFNECKLARPVALVSGSPEKARTVAAQYGIEAVYGYDEMNRLAENAQVQAVYLVTPNGLHAEQLRAAAKAGKHVLSEKPMANNAEQARQMIADCEQAAVKLMVAYRCQYEVFNREAARLVQSGELGRARVIEASNTQVQGPAGQWRLNAALAGGGALPDIGLYCLNGVRAMLGEDPIELYAQVVNPQGDPRYTQVEETISFMLRFPSGAIANCSTSYGAHESKDLRIHLELGKLDLENAFAYRGQRLRIAHRHGSAEAVDELRLGAKNQFALEIDHFADCILNGKSPRTPGEEGLQDHLLMEAIYCSARENRPVAIDWASEHSPVRQ